MTDGGFVLDYILDMFSQCHTYIVTYRQVRPKHQQEHFIPRNVHSRFSAENQRGLGKFSAENFPRSEE